MTEQIVLTITPADDGVSCGECKWRLTGSYSNGIDWCDAFTEDSDELQKIVNGKRVESCLAAARTLREEREEREAARRVIEAGSGIARCLPKKPVVVTGPATDLAAVMSKIIFDKVEAWYAAVAQYEAARGEGR